MAEPASSILWPGIAGESVAAFSLTQIDARLYKHGHLSESVAAQGFM